VMLKITTNHTNKNLINKLYPFYLLRKTHRLIPREGQEGVQFLKRDLKVVCLVRVHQGTER
jgi:hypothetical protein